MSISEPVTLTGWSVRCRPECNFLDKGGHWVRKLVNFCRETRAATLNVIGVGASEGHIAATDQP